MSKLAPLYLLLTLILFCFVAFGTLLLRKANAIEKQLATIRTEQMKEPRGPRPLGAVPVWVMNEPLKVERE
jgi:hypothetical protein